MGELYLAAFWMEFSLAYNEKELHSSTSFGLTALWSVASRIHIRIRIHTRIRIHIHIHIHIGNVLYRNYLLLLLSHSHMLLQAALPLMELPLHRSVFTIIFGLCVGTRMQ